MTTPLKGTALDQPATSTTSHVAVLPRHHELSITGSSDIDVRGSGNKWQISLRAQPKVQHRIVAKKTVTASCPLQASLVTVEGSPKIQFAWGPIQGMQPAGFSAGGDPPYQMDATEGFYYAYADFDTATGTATGSGIFYDASGTLQSTETRALSVIASISSSGSLASVCGPFSFDVCGLALPT